jgi:hypothetical protein
MYYRIITLLSPLLLATLALSAIVAPQALAAPSQAAAQAATATSPFRSTIGAHLAAPVGGDDIGRYCQGNGYSGAQLVEPNAYGWRCVSSGRQDYLSMTGLCHRFFGPNWIDRTSDYNDPNSWQCVPTR